MDLVPLGDRCAVFKGYGITSFEPASGTHDFLIYSKAQKLVLEITQQHEGANRDGNRSGRDSSTGWSKKRSNSPFVQLK